MLPGCDSRSSWPTRFRASKAIIRSPLSPVQQFAADFRRLQTAVPYPLMGTLACCSMDSSSSHLASTASTRSTSLKPSGHSSGHLTRRRKKVPSKEPSVAHREVLVAEKQFIDCRCSNLRDMKAAKISRSRPRLQFVLRSWR